MERAGIGGIFRFQMESVFLFFLHVYNVVACDIQSATIALRMIDLSWRGLMVDCDD